MRMDLEQAIAALPENLREAFLLGVVEGFDHKEVAAQLDIRPDNVRARISRAWPVCGRCWRDRNESESRPLDCRVAGVGASEGFETRRSGAGASEMLQSERTSFECWETPFLVMFQSLAIAAAMLLMFNLPSDEFPDRANPPPSLIRRDHSCSQNSDITARATDSEQVRPSSIHPGVVTPMNLLFPRTC